MKKIYSAEKIIQDVSEYLLAFLIIIECNSLFNRTANNNSDGLVKGCLVFSIAIFTTLIIYFFIRYNTIFNDFPRFIPILAFIVAHGLIFYYNNIIAILDGKNSRNFLINFLIILPLSTIYFWCKRKTGQAYDLFLKMADLICIFALLSFVTYLAVMLQYNNTYAEVINIRWGDESGIPVKRLNYYNLFVVCLQYIKVGGHTFILPKNIGIYPEPPMYALALNTALYSEMYLRKREERQPVKWVLLTLTLFTTQASIGITFAMAAWGIKAFQAIISKCNGVLRILGCIIFLVVLIAAICVLYKFKSSASSAQGSINTHIEDFKIGLQAFLNKPIWGGGYNNGSYLKEFMTEYRRTHNSGFSNTIMSVFAEGGIVLGVFCTLPYLIGMLHIFKKENKDTAFWAAGMFGCYVFVIFNYHMLLMITMAYGYSCLYFHHGLKMYDTPTVEGKPLIRWNAKFLLPVCGFSLLMILFGKPVWSALRKFLLSHSLYVSQSGPKLACFWLLLIIAGVVLRDSLLRKRLSDRIRGTVGVIASLVIYGLLYNRIYEFINGNLTLQKNWSEGKEAIYLLLIYLVILTVCMLASSLTLDALKRHRVITVAVPATVIVLFIWHHATKTGYYLKQINYRIVSDMECIRLIDEIPEAELYADSEAVLYRSKYPKMKYCATMGDGFVGYDEATVIMPIDKDCTELFNAGWLMTQISKYSVLYTNQQEVIDALTAEGYTFYSHYPLKVDTSAWDSLSAGKYLVTFYLHLDQVPEETQNIGTVRVKGKYKYRYNQIGAQIVSSSEFDEKGDAVIRLTIKAPDCSGVSYDFDAKEGIECTLTKSEICKTPDYDTRYEYDGRHLVMREMYSDGMGNPVITEYGAQIEYEYDRNRNVVLTTYEDSSGNPLNCSKNYAQIQRTYNSANKCVREAYYLSNGSPAFATDKGYSIITYDYDNDGNKTEEWYYDASGNLILNDDGFAGWKRTYNEHKQILSITYYGIDGNSVITSYGYAEIKYSYDEEGHLTSVSYYDESEQPMNLWQ